MANLASKAATSASVSFGQRMWNAMSAWVIRHSGFQRLGGYGFLCFSEHFTKAVVIFLYL